MNTTIDNKYKNKNTILSVEAHAALSEAVENRILTQLKTVKHEVLTEYQNVLGGNEPLLRLALIEAEAIARQTEFPYLVFPLLATEKAQNAARWQHHQRYLLRSNSPAYSAAYALAA